jgi:group I intron endonuclease
MLTATVMPPAPGVYRIVNLRTGRAYVGSSRNLRRRLTGHLSQLRRGAHHATHLQHSWNKHGEDSFGVEILELVLDDPVLLAAREQHHLGKQDGRQSYNSQRFAYSSREPSAETKAKISAAKRGHPVSAETRAKIGAANRGKKRSPQACANIRAAQRGRKGRPWTPEQRDARSAAARARRGKPYIRRLRNRETGELVPQTSAQGQMGELHQLIREARLKHDWTRKRLADEASNGEIEVTEDMVRYLEIACQRSPRTEVLRAVATALSLPWPMVRAAAGYE